MITYTLYALRGQGEQPDARGETLILAALRVMQDCPGNAIGSRRVCSFIFSTRALFDARWVPGSDGRASAPSWDPLPQSTSQPT